MLGRAQIQFTMIPPPPYFVNAKYTYPWKSSIPEATDQAIYVMYNVFCECRYTNGSCS